MVGFKSLFQKSPLMNQAVHGATIYDINLPINTQYGRKSRHSRENGNQSPELVKQTLETRLPNGREAVPNSIRSRGLHEVIVIPGFETVKSP